MAKEDKTSDRLGKLKALLAGKTTLLIVLQDNPDPDAIGAAMALRKIANSFGSIQCSLAHGGTIGRAENRALVNYLGINLRQVGELDVHKFDAIATVDTQPGTGNNSLPPGIVPDIVIDHHPIRQETRSCSFIDIRRRYGATATILFEYLQQADIKPDVPLATALLYGIRSDTQDLGREATRADMNAIGVLYPIANKRMLGQIQRGAVRREYYRHLSDVLQNARIYASKVIVTTVGQTDNPDMIGETADLLLRDEQTNWSVCYGYYQNKMLISVRTEDPAGDAGKVVHKMVSRKGTGGGHVTYAGGQIPADGLSKTKIARLEKLVVKRLLKALNITETTFTQLI